MRKRFFVSIATIAFFSFSSLAVGQTTSFGDVLRIIDPGDENSSVGETDDAMTTLIRRDDGVAMTFNTSGLRRNAPYTTWWVVFNNPENCQTPCACNFPDVFNPTYAGPANTAVFWASGRITDRFGQAVFSAQTKIGEIPDGHDQVVFGPGLLDPNAEIHLVTRTHGRRLRRDKLESQLTEFNGFCSPECFDEQVSVHRSPSCGN